MVLDPARDSWLRDHRPTYTIPVLPLMSMADLVAGWAQQAGGGRAVEIADMNVRRWVTFAAGPRRLDARVLPRSDGWVEVRVAVEDEAGQPENVSTGRVRLAGQYERPRNWELEPLETPTPIERPYAGGRLFHGRSFHVVESLTLGRNGSSAVLRAEARGVPAGVLNPAVLDGVTHAIPADDLARWSPMLGGDEVAFPARIAKLLLHSPPPVAGDVRSEVRFAGLTDGDRRFPAVRALLSSADGPWADLTLVLRLFPKGPLGSAAPAQREAFLRDRRYVPGVALSRVAGAATRLNVRDVIRSDWLPGTLAAIYGAGGDADALAAQIAVKEHAARRLRVHPSEIRVSPGLDYAELQAAPARGMAVRVRREGREVVVEDG